MLYRAGQFEGNVLVVAIMCCNTNADELEELKVELIFFELDRLATTTRVFVKVDQIVKLHGHRLLWHTNLKDVKLVRRVGESVV